MMVMAASEVPVASRSPYSSQSTRSGTMTMPPPTPNRPENNPANVPISPSVRVRPRRMAGILRRVAPALALADGSHALRDPPARPAILLDVDGTLAPIVRHADDAHVPEVTRSILIQVSKR